MHIAVDTMDVTEEDMDHPTPFFSRHCRESK